MTKTRRIREAARTEPTAGDRAKAARMVDPVRAQERTERHHRNDDESVTVYAFTVYRRDGERCTHVNVTAGDADYLVANAPQLERAREIAKQRGREKLINDALGIADDC